MSANFNLVKRGYDPTEVDAYIDTLENVVRSYKDKDRAIKNAILSAQIAADNIVSEAKDHADEIVANSLTFLNDIRDSVSEQYKLIDNFQLDYNDFMSKYLKEISQKDFDGFRQKIKALDVYYRKLSKEKQPIPRSVSEVSVADKLLSLLNDNAE
jgi:DivIVA domain-containing protein